MAQDPQIQLIKDRVDILEFVREFVEVKPAGRYFKACCPFHSEKTPSFMVSSDRGTWHCFGCNEGGDIFSFLQKIDGVTFIEALQILAKRAGVQLERINKTTAKKQGDALTRIQNLLFDAAQVYHTILLESSGAQEARDYMRKRGVEDGTVRSFMIGYAPDRWDVLYNVLQKRGYDVKEMLLAGMMIKNDRGRVYDRFRDRIMFPIWNQHGNVVGFTGRLLHDKEGQGKYVNTPQTKLFDKGSLLYGMDRAKQAIRIAGEAVVVEGQMDVIASHQAGCINTVASSGTALGEVQLKLLKRYCSRIKMAFDADDAGQAAAMRGILLALQEGFDVRVIRLEDEDGKDPDDCILKSVDTWKKRVAEAQPYIAWAIEGACATFDIGSAVGKRQASEYVLPLIARLPSAVEADHWLGELAHRLGVTVDALSKDMGTHGKRNSKYHKQEMEPESELPPLTAPEMLLALFVRVGASEVDLAEFSERFFPIRYHPLVLQLKKGYSDDSTIQIRDQLDMRLSMDYSAYSDEQFVKEYQRVLAVCKDRYKKAQISVLARHIRDAEARGDDTRVAKLMDAYRSITS